MDSSSQKQKLDDVDVMEVPEIHGDLLMELLDASLAAENAGGHHQHLGLVADGDCWIDDSQGSYDIHAHQDCEDCGLDDGGGILPDFNEYGGASRRLRSSAPPPYVVFDHVDDTLEWAETADADDAMDPFTSECGWYMDGLVMAMEWEEEQDDVESGGFPFEPSCYGGEAATVEQVYASPLWE